MCAGKEKSYTFWSSNFSSNYKMFMTQFSGPLSHSHKTEVVIHTYKRIRWKKKKKNSFSQGSKLVHARQATHISTNHNVGILGQY